MGRWSGERWDRWSGGDRRVDGSMERRAVGTAGAVETTGSMGDRFALIAFSLWATRWSSPSVSRRPLRHYITNLANVELLGSQSSPCLSMDFMTDMMSPSCFFALATAMFIISFVNDTCVAFCSAIAIASDK